MASLGEGELASPRSAQDRPEHQGDAAIVSDPGWASVIIRHVPEDHDADGQRNDLLDDGLSDIPGR
jgi:hypothetical protein